MKKNVFIIVFIFCMVSLCKSQTTTEEYNYVSSGLLDNLQKGQDLKSGYELQETGISETITRGDDSWRKAKIYYFNLKKTKTLKAYAVECTGNDGSRRFMCIPTSNSSIAIWDRAWKDFNGTGCEWHSVFMWALMKLAVNK